MKYLLWKEFKEESIRNKIGFAYYLYSTDLSKTFGKTKYVGHGNRFYKINKLDVYNMYTYDHFPFDAPHTGIYRGFTYKFNTSIVIG